MATKGSDKGRNDQALEAAGAGAGEAAPEPPGGPIPVAPKARRTTPKSRTPSVKMKAAGSSGPASSRMPASQRIPASQRAPSSRRIPVSNKAAPSRRSTAPKSTAAPSTSETATPKTATPKTAASKSAPRSLKGSAPPGAREEVSIPPTWSDVDERGTTVAAAEATPILPAPLPTKVSSHAEELAAVPVPFSRWVAPYAKGALALVAAACFLFAGRAYLHRGVKPVHAAAAAPPPVETAPAIPPPVEAAEAPPATTAADAVPTSPDEDKKASLEALKLGKLAEAVAAGERATLLDPTDADAWLVLGAAYEDQGNFIAAQRCFHTCVTEAKRGEVRECKFLMR